MMKLLTQMLCITTVSTLIGCASNPPKEKFKEYHTSVFRIENGTRIKEEESRFVQEYDEQGEVSKILYYNDAPDTLSSYTERHLDPPSGIVTHIFFDASGTKEDWSEAQLQEGKIVWSKHYDSTGTLIQVLQSKFDDQGRKTESLYLKGDGAILHKLVYEYDDKENKKTRTTYDAEGMRKPGKIIDLYDENNNLIRQDWYDSPDRIHLTFEYTYLGDKRQTEVQTSQGKAFKKREFEYDDRGNEKETRTYESVGDSDELTLSEIRTTNYKY